MSQFRQAAVPDHRSGALESVGSSEDLVDHSRIQLLLELQQTSFDLPYLLQGLVGEQAVVARLQIESQAHGLGNSGERRPLICAEQAVECE